MIHDKGFADDLNSLMDEVLADEEAASANAADEPWPQRLAFFFAFLFFAAFIVMIVRVMFG